MSDGSSEQRPATVDAADAAAESPPPAMRGSYDSESFVDFYARLRERGLFTRERRAIAAYFPAGGRVLDLGCGAGRTTAPLVEQGFDVVAVDVSRPMVAAAASDGDGPVAATYAIADAAALPFTSDSFDAVLFSYNGLDELRPAAARDAALAEIRRVLAPGGVFAFTSRNRLRWLVPFPPTPPQLRRLWRYWALNGLEANWGTPYRRDVTTHSPKRVHVTDPRTQRRRLADHGFHTVALLGRSGPLSAWFGPSLFFVAKTGASSG